MKIVLILGLVFLAVLSYVTISAERLPVSKYLIVSTAGDLYLLDTFFNPPKLTQISPSTVEIRPFCSSCGSGYNEIHFDKFVIIPTTNYVLIVDTPTASGIRPITCDLHGCSPYILEARTNNESALEVIVDCSSSETDIDVRRITVSEVTCKVNNLSKITLTSANITSRLLLLSEGKYLYFYVSNGEVFYYTWPGQSEAEQLTLRSNCQFARQIVPFEGNKFFVECGSESMINYTAIYSQSSGQVESANLLEPHIKGNLMLSDNKTFLLSWSTRDNVIISNIANVQNPVFLRPIQSNMSVGSNLTSLCFLTVGGYPHVALAMSGIGLFNYNISEGRTLKGVAQSYQACTEPQCIGVQSPVENYIFAGNKDKGATLYNLLQSTSHGPFAKDLKVSRLIPLPLLQQPANHPTPASNMGYIAGIIAVVLVVSAVVCVLVMVVYIIYRRKKSNIPTSTQETERHTTSRSPSLPLSNVSSDHHPEDVEVEDTGNEVRIVQEQATGAGKTKLVCGNKAVDSSGRESPVGSDVSG